MQIIRIAPPNPSRNRVRMKGKEVENAPYNHRADHQQDRGLVRRAQLQKNPGGDKVSQILAAEMALLTEEGMVYTPNSWAMSVVTMDPTIQRHWKKQ